MAVSFIARMSVKQEMEQAFIGHCQALEAAVRAAEPECLYYKFYKLEEPLRYAVFESFTTHAAEQAHQASDHFKRIAPDLIACLDGTYVREYLHDLEGTGS